MGWSESPLEVSLVVKFIIIRGGGVTGCAFVCHKRPGARQAWRRRHERTARNAKRRERGAPTCPVAHARWQSVRREQSSIYSSSPALLLPSSLITAVELFPSPVLAAHFYCSWRVAPATAAARLPVSPHWCRAIITSNERPISQSLHRRVSC